MQQRVRVRAKTADGRVSWFDAEVCYVFSGPLDLAVLRVAANKSRFVAATLQGTALHVGEAIIAVSFVLSPAAAISLYLYQQASHSAQSSCSKDSVQDV